MNLISCRERGRSWEYRPAAAQGSQKKSEIIGNRYYLLSASKSWKLMVARLRRHLIQLVLPAKLLGKSIAQVANLIEEKKRRRRGFFFQIYSESCCLCRHGFNLKERALLDTVTILQIVDSFPGFSRASKRQSNVYAYHLLPA